MSIFFFSLSPQRENLSRSGSWFNFLENETKLGRLDIPINQTRGLAVGVRTFMFENNLRYCGTEE